MNDQQIYRTAVYCGGEFYVVCFDAATWGDALRQLARWAADESLTMTWKAAYDTARQMNHEIHRGECRQ